MIRPFAPAADTVQRKRTARRLAWLPWLAVVSVMVVATAMRFVHTEQAPLGFYRDEAAIAAHVICLAESGRTLDDARWPLLTQVLGGGYSSIVWQAPAAAWATVTGPSIGAIRSFAAVCGMLTVLGVFFFAFWGTGSRRTGAFAALAAAVSPWAFQFSRVAWDADIAPVYLSWGCASLLLAMSPRAPGSPWLRRSVIVFSALFFAAACTSYPPQRVQVPLILLAFVVWKWPYVRKHLPDAALFTAIAIAYTAQLWRMTMSGSIQGRYQGLSVFSPDYWADEGVTSHAMVLLNGLWLFVKNVFAHFSPTYLFVSGDSNARHSTQSLGEWSWLDAVALLSAATLMARRRTRVSGWVAFLGVAYLAGVVPAALTWEGIPHALRSIGALPFLAVLVGTALTTLCAELPHVRRFVPIGASVLGAIFAIRLCTVFFTTYATGANDSFDGRVVQQLMDSSFIDQAVAAERAGNMQTGGDSYPMMAIRYYELRTGALQCAPSGPLLVEP